MSLDKVSGLMAKYDAKCFLGIRSTISGLIFSMKKANRLRALGMRAK
jgi:hypothetical protein